jgi:hypothetical protein
MLEPAANAKQERLNRFLLGLEAVYFPSGSNPRLKPETAFRMTDFWHLILNEAPANLNIEYGGRVLDARGFTITDDKSVYRFEVHAALAHHGVKFSLYAVHGVNGSRRLESVRSSFNLGDILYYLMDYRDAALAEVSTEAAEDSLNISFAVVPMSFAPRERIRFSRAKFAG